MSYLSLAKQTQIISGLVEGNSIRSMERMTGAHRDTIMRLAQRVGTGCAKIMDEEMRGLTCHRLQADEIWAFVAKKQKQVTEMDDTSKVGDFWTYVALDSDTKLVPTFVIGKRDRVTTEAFCNDLASRLVNRPQLSTDAFGAYANAVDKAFGVDVDYGQVVKFYDSPHGTGRYSPPVCTGAKRTPISGRPVLEDISTSHVERQNLTMRMQMRRYTRLTNGFSKTVDGMRAAASLHFAHYNFVRIHQSLRVTPAVEAGVSSKVWTLEELVERTAWTGA